MEECGLKCNAINLRFRDKYIGGEFGNHEPSISQDAIALCREAADACRKLGGNQMIIWLGFDGFDYSFQIDYVSYWNRIVKAFRDVCDYSGVPVSIEYKPYEERVHAFIDSFGTAVSVLHDVDRENLGVTLDFCHMLMKRRILRLRQPGCWNGGNSTIYISTTERVPRMTAYGGNREFLEDSGGHVLP